MNRRELIKGAAWSVPVIAATIATPLASASEPPVEQGRIGFTNVTATVGKKPNTVYFNTKVLETTGVPVTGLMVSVTFEQGGTVQTHNYVEEPHITGWGATKTIRFEPTGFSKEGLITVHLTATANNVTMITDYATVTPPRWWN